MNIIVVPYDPAWPALFEQLRAPIAQAVGEVAVAIEHVGSTAVPGLWAKPVIDMSVVVANSQGVAIAIERLATLGYQHRGDLGIEEREAFYQPANLPAHHLYVCPQGCLALRNHLAVRDHLRSDSTAAKAYGELKQKLAQEFANDIEGYIDGKTDFLMNILSRSGMRNGELESIARGNRRE